MRPLEGLLVAALIVALFMRWQQPRNRQVTATLLAMLGILTALHVFFDGARWEMIPAYVMGIVGAWIFFRDLQRVSGAKAGESSRWAAVPSTGQRALRGTLLGVAAILAVAIPLWAFPRIAMPDLDGYYDVGRLDVTLTDAARGNRSIAVTVWYPAETPNGRVLRYHPEPGVLGSSLAQGSPLPSFAFRNLTAAKTHSTLEPRFNLREGRSPIILASHDAGGSRYEGTGLYEHLASNGYIVASVGGDGSDGTVNVGERTADLAFVLGRLVSLPAGGSALDTLNTHVRADRIALIGRGVGAAAVLDLAATEPRVTAVVAIAPREITATARNGVRRPFLAFTVNQPTDGLDDAFRYGGTEARLEGATDATLSDRALLGSPVVSLLGIESGDDPRDVHAAVSALTLRFLDQYLKDRREQTEVDLPSRVRVTMVPHQPR